jgi:hypothetical protein
MTSYTRRMVLRDAARWSLAATASSALPFLTGCPRKPKPDPNCIGDNRKAFCPGIRVFFIGAWLFCKDPVTTGMLALTRDMSDPKMSHRFPYGVWQGNAGFDQNPDQLCPNPSAPGSPRNAYPVTLPGFDNGFESIDDLFADAVRSCSMSYISNPNRDINPDFTSANIRVISIPFPTRLITAGFAPSSCITSSDENHPIHSPTSSTDTKSGEVAATYIFEYMGANSLAFNGQQRIASPSTDFPANFHFHTVPPIGSTNADPNHPVKMFANLMSLVGLDKVKLLMPYPHVKPKAGNHRPDCVNELELDIPFESVRVGDTASCAGGGHGIGGGG